MISVPLFKNIDTVVAATGFILAYLCAFVKMMKGISRQNMICTGINTSKYSINIVPVEDFNGFCRTHRKFPYSAEFP